MLKIFKLFLPKTSTFAMLAAEKIANFANKNQDKMLILAKYDEYVKKAASFQIKLAEWIKDGKIDKIETTEISKELIPLFDKLYELL